MRVKWEKTRNVFEKSTIMRVGCAKTGNVFEKPNILRVGWANFDNVSNINCVRAKVSIVRWNLMNILLCYLIYDNLNLSNIKRRGSPCNMLILFGT